MNISLLTIDSTLAATTGASSTLPKPDEIRKGAKFSLTPDDEHPQVNSLEKPKADNVRDEVQNREEFISKSPQEFTQSIRKRPKSENPCDDENITEPKEQSAASGTIKQTNEQQNLIKRWLAEHIVAVQQGKEGTATKIDPNAGWQLAQIIANTRTGKSPPVTGHAVKSAEIKLLHSTEKGQLGLKTVLPTTSEGQNGLKTVLPETPKSTIAGKKQPETGNNTDKLSVSPKAIAETKSVTENGNTKELVPELLANTGKSTTLPETPKSALAGKKQPGTGNNTDKLSVLARTIAETKSVTEKGNTKELAPELPANTGKSTTNNSGKTSAVNINLPTIQAKASEMQLQPAGIDPEKPVPTEETEAKTTASEILSKLLNPNGKETTHTGNNLSENQSVQKLNIAAVQVSTGQTKDQGNSTSNKNTSQGFEQMLSHNTPQTLITEQTPAAARNAMTANMPGQNSSSNVSADIGKQILESIHSSISQQGAERQITIRLNPPELGKVSITFRQQDAELTGLMEVSKAQTRIEIEQTLPQIIRNLADSGIQIKRLEVMLSNEEQSGQGTHGNQSTQSGGTHQQNSANPGTPENNQNINESNEWLASNNSYENLSELQEALITDGSIDMLV